MLGQIWLVCELKLSINKVLFNSVPNMFQMPTSEYKKLVATIGLNYFEVRQNRRQIYSGDRLPA